MNTKLISNHILFFHISPDAILYPFICTGIDVLTLSFKY